MIEVKNLYKSYGKKEAVKDVSFEIRKGEVLGFIGPNGAGKSTTMRIITGFINATSGDVLVNGHSVTDSPLKTKQVIGYLPESAPSYVNMTVYGFLKFCATMRGVPRRELKQVINEAMTACFLDSVRNQKIETLSKGFRHRTSLAQALLGNPEVLILDEPTDGLDPNQKHQVRKLIREWGKEKAVIISTHILEEVDAVCDRIVLINEGQIQFNGSPDEFKAIGLNHSAVTLQCAEVDAETMTHAIEAEPFVDNIERISSHSIKVHGTCPHSIKEQLYHITQAKGWRITELSQDSGRLDDVFRTLTLEGDK